MVQVVAQMSVSVDGCYAGPVFRGDGRDVPGWMASPEALGLFRVTCWATMSALIESRAFCSSKVAFEAGSGGQVSDVVGGRLAVRRRAGRGAG